MAVIDKGPYYFESVRAKFTCQDLLIQHDVAEVIVVLNGPPDPKNPLHDYAAKSGVRLVEMPEPVGTAAPRNRIFEVAENDFVCVVDPHVVLYPGFFGSTGKGSFGHAVADYGDPDDLFQGPMMNERRDSIHATHMNNLFRAQMWGVWGMAWETPKKFRFSCVTHDDHNLEYVTMYPKGGQRPLTTDEMDGNRLPINLGWQGHEATLEKLGFRQPDEPFVIPGHGMGMFACRRDAWLPFHKDCRGFGGEELTTHARFRRAGRQCWCVPGMKWWHDMWRPNGGQVPYSLTAWHKMRNYVLEFSALGMDPTPVRRHFNPPEHEWRQALAGVEWPANTPPPPDVTIPAGHYGDVPPGRGYEKVDGVWRRSGGKT